MKQSKKHSLVEAFVNVGSGMVIAFSTTQLLAPILGITISLHANGILTIILTTVSIIRSYCWRRAFNWYVYRCHHTSVVAAYSLEENKRITVCATCGKHLGVIK